MSRIIFDDTTDKFYVESLKEIQASQLRLTPTFAAPIDKGVTLVSNGSCSWVVKEIMEIFFASAFKLSPTDEDTVELVPRLTSDGSTFPCRMRFLPYEYQRIFLVLNITKDSSQLLSVDTRYTGPASERILYHAGVNNVHASGALCIGSARVPSARSIYTDGLIPWLNEWYNAWSSSEYNRDLVYTHHQYTLRFSPDTMTNLPLEQDWTEVISRLSGAQSEDKKILSEVIAKTLEVGHADTAS